MPVVAVINYKGGVGKTTTTANLAAELAWRGKRILLIDMDAQASLTFSFVRPDYWSQALEKSKTIKAWFDSFEDGPPVLILNLWYSSQQPSLRYYGAAGAAVNSIWCLHISDLLTSICS